MKVWLYGSDNLCDYRDEFGVASSSEKAIEMAWEHCRRHGITWGIVYAEEYILDWPLKTNNVVEKKLPEHWE